MDWERIKKVFKQHGFSVQYFDTGEQAVAYLAGETAGKSVSFGGSKTLEALGAYEALSEKSEVKWHWKGDGYCQAPDVYITSANAVSETGELVNIDNVITVMRRIVFAGRSSFIKAPCYHNNAVN